MNRDQILIRTRKLVLIERALYVSSNLKITIDSIARYIGANTHGHVQWALAQLALEGIMYTRRQPEGAIYRRAYGPKLFVCRYTREEAIARCKELGIDLRTHYGMHERQSNSNRLSGKLITNPSYAVPE